MLATAEKAKLKTNENGRLIFPAPSKKGKQPLYFDLETIPDYDRLGLFDLPPVAEFKERKSVDCPDKDSLLKMSVDEIQKELLGIIPEDDYLESLESVESCDKARKGVVDAIRKVKYFKAKLSQANDDRIKKLSVTPEYCKIASVGMAYGNDPVFSFSLGDELDNGKTVTEFHLLNAFWDAAKCCHPLIGYNVLGFDIPVLFFRSALFRIEASKFLDLRTWGTDVIDLMVKRWPKGGQMKLKQACKCAGIEIPAGETDGSCVADLLENDPEKLHEYVESDIEITRKLHHLYRGYFCF